jgi:hypothetical protein
MPFFKQCVYWQPLLALSFSSGNSAGVICKRAQLWQVLPGDSDG